MSRNIVLIFLINLLCVLLFSASFAADIVYAEFGVVGKRTPKENDVFIVEDGRSMFPEEVLKVNYKLKRGEAIYIIWQSPRGNHTLINSNNTTPEKNTTYSTEWYSLDFESGHESIFVIVSVSRSKKLEKLFAELAVSAGKDLSRINEMIAREISSIKMDSKENMKSIDLSSQADTPVEGGAVFRGSGTGEFVMNKKVFGNRSSYDQISIIHKK